MASTLVIAHLKFTDKARYDRYAAAFPALFAGSGGQVLAADEAPQLLTGDGSGTDKIVVLQFASLAAAEQFLNSPDYCRIAEDRDAGAAMNSWIVQGLETMA